MSSGVVVMCGAPRTCLVPVGRLMGLAKTRRLLREVAVPPQHCQATSPWLALHADPPPALTMERGELIQTATSQPGPAAALAAAKRSHSITEMDHCQHVLSLLVAVMSPLSPVVSEPEGADDSGGTLWKAGTGSTKSGRTYTGGGCREGTDSFQSLVADRAWNEASFF